MQVQAYLLGFNGRCEDAITFYKQTLGAIRQNFLVAMLRHGDGSFWRSVDD